MFRTMDSFNYFDKASMYLRVLFMNTHVVNSTINLLEWNVCFIGCIGTNLKESLSQ